mmetsp:Transcript_54388/g.174402  ORF Transcript_54388/g.174402 Transcript_54388/m.174402 type:complete len:268 (-) Transcript_54388:49-852(-)
MHRECHVIGIIRERLQPVLHCLVTATHYDLRGVARALHTCEAGLRHGGRHSPHEVGGRRSAAVQAPQHGAGEVSNERLPHHLQRCWVLTDGEAACRTPGWEAEPSPVHRNAATCGVLEEGLTDVAIRTSEGVAVPALRLRQGEILEVQVDVMLHCNKVMQCHVTHLRRAAEPIAVPLQELAAGRTCAGALLAVKVDLLLVPDPRRHGAGALLKLFAVPRMSLLQVVVDTVEDELGARRCVQRVGLIVVQRRSRLKEKGGQHGPHGSS